MTHPEERAVDQEEFRWTDDRIRWTEDDHDHDDRKPSIPQVDDDDEGACLFDPFADADPFDTFTYQNVTVRGYKRDADAVWQSTGLTLWRASEYLCDYLAENPRRLLRRRRILELGAGLGLCGLLAHHLAPDDCDVCITDGDTDALSHLRDNVERNRRSSHVEARQLLWGRDTTARFLERQRQAKNSQIPPQEYHYDVLLASDIVYAAVIVQPLWETVAMLLQRTADAVFIMAYAQRDVPVTIQDVLEAADQAGFDHQLVAEDPQGIWVYEFRWKKQQLLTQSSDDASKES